MIWTSDELEHIARQCPDLRNKALRLLAGSLVPTVQVQRSGSEGAWLIDGRRYFDGSESFARALRAISKPQDVQPGGNSLLVAIKARGRMLRRRGFLFLAEAFDCFTCAGGVLTYRPRQTTPRVVVDDLISV